MAVPSISLISPHESSDDEYSDFEIYSSSEDESLEDESSELENTSGGSRHSLSSLEREETEPNGTEEEFWVKYPYLKELAEIIVAQGFISKNDAFERLKVIGDEKAKELNDRWKALCIKEQHLRSQMLDLLDACMEPGI